MKSIIEYIYEKFNNPNRGDEFYTDMKDIKKELSNYNLSGKNIYCNCDNPSFSNFWKYLHNNFSSLGLKNLYATYYDDEPKFYKFDGKNVEIEDITSGLFQDNENIMKDYNIDIVITNPPFSDKLPNKLIDICLKNNVDFLIVSPLHLITSKDIFTLYKNGDINVGYNTIDSFVGPSGDKRRAPCCWYTTLDVDHKKINFDKEYSEEEYPKYDDYDAVDCEKSKNIPKDYSGNIGVSYRFMTKLNRDQFEIVDILSPKLDGKKLFKKLIIKHKI